MVESLFSDFETRALRNGHELLKQLSFLSVGPLVTFDTGRDLKDNPQLLQLFERFKEV